MTITEADSEYINRELDLRLKRMAQEKFIETYQNEDFLAIFGRNYL